MAFVTFMVGQNLEGFNQWKELFCLLSHAKDGVHPDVSYTDKTDQEVEAEKLLQLQKISNGRFWQEVIRCLFSMLKQFPESFFYEVLSQGSFIVDCLLALMESLENYINTEPIRLYFCDEEKMAKLHQTHLEEQKQVGVKALALKKLLSEKFNFNLNEVVQEVETGEDAPVVVEDPSLFYKF